MKRVAIGFFLSLFLILSGGYSQLYAQGLEECMNFVPFTQIAPIHPVTDKRLYNIDATTVEEQDDDTSASKKLLDSRLPIITLKFFADYSVRSLETSWPSPSIPSKRYFILLRVFRI
jgi:hypothetical protein